MKILRTFLMYLVVFLISAQLFSLNAARADTDRHLGETKVPILLYHHRFGPVVADREERGTY